MNDPKQVLQLHFTTTQQGIDVCLDRIEVLTETLRKVLPKFAKEHLKQTELQDKRRAEQASALGHNLPDRTDQLILAFQKLFGTRT